HLLFGMPPMAVLPAILTKSVFLACSAAFAAHYFKRISIPILLLVVLTYQIFGTLVEWAMIGDFFKAVQDFRIGVPGMLIQILGGYCLINYLLKR
ncbi:MAG: ECF transporter S component, partial [Tannerellaceae bacterium]